MKQKKYRIYTCVFAVLFFSLSIVCWLKPADAFSVTERRPLDQFPTLNVNTLLNGSFMSKFEEYTLDQFPLRDDFRSLKAMVSKYVLGQKDNNNIYIVDGQISELDVAVNEKALSKAINKFTTIYDTYMKDTNVHVYYSMIPDKNYFLAEQHGYPALDYDVLREKLHIGLDYMQYIDIFPLLSIGDYYYTDTHWRQDCIVDVAKHLADAMGTDIDTVYTTQELDNPFYGVYYGQLGLPVDADRITYLTNDTLANCIVYDHQNNREMSMYDMDKAADRDPYEMFLGGSLAVITIDNPNANTDKELVIFRDSFGSSIAPLLVEGYAKITLLDARYLHQNMIGNFVTFDNQDVLFLHSTSVLNNEIAFK